MPAQMDCVIFAIKKKETRKKNDPTNHNETISSSPKHITNLTQTLVDHRGLQHRFQHAGSEYWMKEILVTAVFHIGSA